MRLKNCKLFGKRGLSILLTLILCTGMVTPAFAIQYDMKTGSVHVENDDEGNAVSWQDNHEQNYSKETASKDTEIIVTGTTNANTVIVGEGVTDTTITLSDVTIESKDTSVSIGQNSDVKLELDGKNSIESGISSTGLFLNTNANVTIQDAKKAENSTPASLHVQGGRAGIGGGTSAGAGSITITDGAVVEAYVKDYSWGGAGIGAGDGLYGGDCSVGDILITGGAKVTAQGSIGAAGIGAGKGSYSSSSVGNITIEGGATVTATGGRDAAGIGAGEGDRADSSAGNIIIRGGAEVAAVSKGTSTDDKSSGAGIGTGHSSSNGHSSVGTITIKDNTNVTAEGGRNFAGIGGEWSSVQSIGDITIQNSTVTATGGMFASGIGGGNAATDIFIKDSTVTATGDYNAPGIGSSYAIGNITIEGSTITAKPGSNGKTAVGVSYYTAEASSTKDITIIGGTFKTGTELARGTISGKGEVKVYTHDGEGRLLYAYKSMDRNSPRTYTIALPEGKEATYNEEDHSVILPPGSINYFIGSDGTVVGEFKLSDGASIDAQGKITVNSHDYQVTKTVPATCTKAGSTTEVCSICGDTKVTPITKLGHDIQTETKAPTCTEAGSVTKTCSRCDYKEVTSQGKPLEHDIQTVTKAATCTEAGSVTETCSRCDYVNVVSTTEKLGHDYQVTETKDATCTEAGSQTEVCSRCKDEKVTTTDPALKHDYQVTETTEASCTDNGSETHTCTRCKDAYTTVLEAPGHTEEIIPAVPATETESGWTEGLRCSECGEVLQAPVEIPATGPVNPENPEQPETPETPDVPAPGGDDDFGDDGAGTATIAEQDVPLAGIVLVKDVLAELYKHAGSPDGEDAEGEYTRAIAWAIANGLMDENDDVDAVVTVAVLKSMLTNYAASVGGVLAVSIDGEDDDVVMNCGEILAEVFKTL